MMVIGHWNRLLRVMALSLSEFQEYMDYTLNYMV